MTTSKTQQNIPKGWTPVKVGDIGSTYSGLRSKNKSDFGHGSPFITYMNIFSNSKIDKNRFDLVNVGVDENQSKVKYGDVFFTVSSETPEEVGMSSVLLDDVDNYYLNSFCFGFRLNDFDSLIPHYARYLFRGNDFRSKIVKMAQGSTRFNLSKERVLSLDITLPPVKEQQKIAEILGAVDEDIAKTQEVIGVTEKLKRGLMQQLFTRGVGHTKFKETKIGLIPEEWEVQKLERFIKSLDAGVSVNSRDVQKDNGEIGILKTSAVTFGVFDPNQHKTVVSEEMTRVAVPVKADRLIVSRMNTRDLVGANAYTDKSFPDLFLPDRLWQVEPNDQTKISMRWLSYVFNLQWKSGFFASLATGTSASMKNLSKGSILNMELAFPTIEEQKEIAEILSAVDEKISVNNKLKEKLTLLKKGLMQDLLSGKVRTINN